MRLTQGRQLPGIFCNLQWSRLHLGPQQDPPSTQLPDTASRLVLASVRTGDVTPVIILQMREPGSQNPGARPGSLVRAVGGLLQWGGSPGWKPSAPRSHFHYNSGRSTPNTALPAPWRLPDSQSSADMDDRGQSLRWREAPLCPVRTSFSQQLLFPIFPLAGIV